jgi:hypothetical protein
VASNYYLQGSRRDVMVLSPTQVVPVQYGEAFTIPSHVYFEYPVPLAVWNDDEGATFFGTIATQIEDLIAQGLAVGGSYVQELDLSGLLVDVMDFIVAYTPANGVQGAFTTTVRIPLNTLAAAIDPFFGQLAGSAGPLLQAALAKLQAMAAL